MFFNFVPQIANNVHYEFFSTPHFHTRTTPFQHPKSVSSTPKPFSSTHPSVKDTPQFNIPLGLFFGVELRGVLN